MTAPAELLNNAIARLEFTNKDNQEIAELTEDWAWWWHGWRTLIPETTPVWWASLQYYFQRYRIAYERAENQPAEYAPERVDPTIPRVVEAQVDRYIEAWSDAGTAAIHSASQAAKSLLPAIGPWLLGAAAIYFLTRRL